MATRSKFNEARRAVILEALEHGASIRTAASLAGVDHSTVLRWLKEGEAASRVSRKREFFEAVQKAEAQVADLAARILVREMRDDPKWAAWWLERRDPAFAPPGAKREPASGQPIVIELKLADGAPPPSSLIEQLPAQLPAG